MKRLASRDYLGVFKRVRVCAPRGYTIFTRARLVRMVHRLYQRIDDRVFQRFWGRG